MSDALQYTLVDGIKCYSIEKSQDYSDYPEEGFELTDKLEKESFWVQSRNRVLKNLVHKYARRFPAATFLEIGCGTGTFIGELSKHEGLTITGSEIYIKGLLYAKKRLPNVEFIQFDATEGKLPQSFNLIGAFDVIEHIDNDSNAIANIYRMLSEDGYFIVTAPQYMFLWSSLDEIVRHKRRYSRQVLLKTIQAEGFRISLCSSFVFVLFPFMLISRVFDRRKKLVVASKAEFENKVSLPKFLNWIFDKLMRIDEFLIERGVSLPFGGSLLVIAQKTRIESNA